MRIWKGKPVSPGYARGTAVVYAPHGAAPAPRRGIGPDEVPGEQRRLREAVEAARRELEHLQQRVRDDLGASEAAIFATHASLLGDPGFLSGVEAAIAGQRMGAEQALEQHIESIAGRFASLPHEDVRDRAADVRDLGRRIMARLTGTAEPALADLPPDSIVVAEELLPSDTMELDRRHVRAIATERGGKASHAAILARALGIPAVSGLEGICEAMETGTPLLVDGRSGTVSADPTNEAAARFADRKQRYDAEVAVARAQEEEDCVTRDGTTVKLLANVGRLGEAREVRAHHLDGIGLLRTEVLFLDSGKPPDFEHQRAFYRRIAETVQGLPVTMRTLDLGGDKHPAFLPAHFGHNPILGLRGLRFSLKEQALLRTQLAAMLDVAQAYSIAIMFPMVVGGDDLARALDALRSVARERGYGRLPPVGAMIETPSACFALDEILEQVEFVSIGTNDLAQYLLAADRGEAELMDEYSVLHPAVLRAIAEIIRRTRAAGRALSVCGEAAGDPDLAPLLLGLGVRELSMSPRRAARVRYAIRHLRLGDAEDLAGAALRCASLEQVRRRLADVASSLAVPA